MRKALDLVFGTRPLHVLSAFQRDSLLGMFYVMDHSVKQVSEAINGLFGTFLSHGTVLGHRGNG